MFVHFVTAYFKFDQLHKLVSSVASFMRCTGTFAFLVSACWFTAKLIGLVIGAVAVS